jgi:hypothetical protein
LRFTDDNDHRNDRSCDGDGFASGAAVSKRMRPVRERPTVVLAAVEVEALLHAAQPAADGEAETIAMVPLVPVEEPRLARGSEAVRPRRRRMALNVGDIVPRRRR